MFSSVGRLTTWKDARTRERSPLLAHIAFFFFNSPVARPSPLHIFPMLNLHDES